MTFNLKCTVHYRSVHYLTVKNDEKILFYILHNYVAKKYPH